MSDWAEKDQQYIWHPFTQMQEWEKESPTIIVEGKGVYLKDLDGKSYLDGSSSIWVNLHGHRKKQIDSALIAQIQKLSHATLLGLSNLPAIELAEKLVKIAPEGLAKVFYSDNGSTAIEIALKIAFGYFKHRGDLKKRKFITFSNAYHGDTVGSVSLGGMPLFHDFYKPLLFETITVPAPYCYRCPLAKTYPDCQMACVDEVEKALSLHHHETAGLVIEPRVQAAAGMITAPMGHLKKIRELCTRYQVLMIADEVAVGFGRTGEMFACEREGVSPDIMAVAKGITGGYLPLAATLTTQKIYDAFLGNYSEFKTFFHGHSYTGNPLGCSAAIANLEIFKREAVLKKLKPKIAKLKQKLAPWKRLRHVGEIRQEGMMIGIELVADKKTKTPYPLTLRIGKKICDEAKENGVLLRPLGNVIVLMPPLSISLREIEKLLSVVGAAIRKITRLTDQYQNLR
jgi:adenosylmethionine-8-amino-7-oxononanoate aminotransferase